MSVRVFGEKKENQDYQLRVGVYMIISDEQNEKLLLVSPPNGSYLLPGGEIEDHETHSETLRRESLEELGYAIEIGTFIGEADEYYYSRHRKQHYQNPAFFYSIDKWRKTAEPLEDFNDLKWAEVEDALKMLKRGSHKWAVEQWQKTVTEKNIK